MASPDIEEKSESLEAGNEDDDDSDKKRRAPLTSSASVPLFVRRKESGDGSDRRTEELGGSDTDLGRLDMREEGLHLAQSYRNNQEAGQAQHKVSTEVKTTEISLISIEVHFTNTESPVPSHHVTFSPVRKSKARSPSFDQRSPLKKKRRHRTFSENSTNLSLASSMTSVSTNTDSYTAPDGGFGWVVVAASFLTNMIADGVTFSFGIMFEEFQVEFSSSSAVTAGVVSVFHAVPLLTGPIATWLADRQLLPLSLLVLTDTLYRYGCRKVTIWGSVLASIGFLSAAFSHHIALLYFFFGVVSGQCSSPLQINYIPT